MPLLLTLSGKNKATHIYYTGYWTPPILNNRLVIVVKQYVMKTRLSRRCALYPVTPHIRYNARGVFRDALGVEQYTELNMTMLYNDV